MLSHFHPPMTFIPLPFPIGDPAPRAINRQPFFFPVSQDFPQCTHLSTRVPIQIPEPSPQYYPSPANPPASWDPQMPNGVCVPHPDCRNTATTPFPRSSFPTNNTTGWTPHTSPPPSLPCGSGNDARPGRHRRPEPIVSQRTPAVSRRPAR